MKKIIFILLFNLTLFASANSCMLDVYFGNGVWNDLQAVQASRDELRTFLQDQNPDKFALADEKVRYDFKYAHNRTHGTLTDLIETYWQLYESGQISEGYFTFIARILDGSITEETFLNDLKTIISQSDGDTYAMYEKYQTESFNQKHNVLLVSHSQGNLFANKIYALLNDDEKQHFRNVAVATPAEKVASGGAYTTLYKDFVINAVPGSLPGNAEGFGHTFVNSYLNNPYDSTVEMIASNIKRAVDALDVVGCSEYTAFQFVSYICNGTSDALEKDVDIYGAYYKDNLVYTEKVLLEHQVEGARDAQGQCEVEGLDIQTTAPSYNQGGCDAYIMKSFSDEVRPMSFENAISCLTYSISSATAQKLNELMATP